jgi:putative ABC transport system ATP-binding protein
MLPAYPTGEAHGLFRRRADELLERFGLTRHAAARVEHLSGGELQRAAIARALINDPAVIIADEPTAHLDSQLSAGFMAMIGDLKAQGKSVLIASHDPIVCDWPGADRVIAMRDGRVVAAGDRP